jgi:hypothetical protein
MYANLINGPYDGETTEIFKPLIDEKQRPAIIVKVYNRKRRAAYRYTGKMDSEDVARFEFWKLD